MRPAVRWAIVVVAGLAVATAVRGTIQSLGGPIAVFPLVGFIALGLADYVQAYMWWSLAAAHGDVDAGKDRDTVASKMTPAQIEQARALAAAWKPKTGK